jgi:hypothetical protein
LPGLITGAFCIAVIRWDEKLYKKTMFSDVSVNALWPECMPKTGMLLRKAPLLHVLSGALQGVEYADVWLICDRFMMAVADLSG